MLLTIASCKTTKDKVQRTRPPAKKERVDTTPKVKDTDKVETPVVKIEEPQVEIKIELPDAIVKQESYNVTFLAPLEASRNLQVDNSDRFIMYYAGMQMASDELALMGAKMNLKIVDTKKNSIDASLNNNVTTETDMIIGPYERDDLKYTIDYSLRNEIPLVSPWQSLNKISKDNPYYVQLSPYLTEYYHSLLQHVSENFKEEDVYIIGRNTDKKDMQRIRGFQGLAREYFKSSSDSPLKFVNAQMSDLDGENPVFANKLSNRKPTIFIVPNWSGSDYEYVYNVLRRLSLEKGLNKVIVYGMFSMLDNKNINFELYNTLNIRVAASSFIDQERYEVKKFKKEFLNVYGTLPSKDAYEGYDHFKFLGGALFKYGKNFQYHLNKDKDYYLQSAFDIHRNYKENADAELIEGIQYFENKHIDILEFDENKFTILK